MSRAYTAEEARKMFLDHMRNMSRYWANLPDKSVQDKLNGLCFSFLSMIDGATMDLPSMDIVLRPHESDKEFLTEQGEDYFEDGMVINDCDLHEEWHER